jgi:hypothetical protein
LIGRIISHFKIIEKLGGGGMGVVYKAMDLKLDRPVALKFLPSQLSSDEAGKERFVVEAKSASSLDHPNICTIYDIDEAPDGQTFIAMAFYEGETLKKRLARGPLPIEDVLSYAIQIARGLAKVHSRDVVHRDIKPANIMLTEDNIPKIVDFGLAKLASSTRITSPGTMMGTPAYMSPEQTFGESVDHRTDIWSLGVVIHEMLTGELPFQGSNPATIVASIQKDTPKEIDTVRSEVPADLRRIVRQALTKDRGKRYQQATDMLVDLEALQEELVSGETKIRQVDAGALRKKRKVLTVSVFGIVILAAAVGAIIWQTQKSRQTESLMAELQPAVEAGRYDEVFEQVRASGLDLNNSRFDALAESAAGTLSIESQPTGANVSAYRVHPIEDFSEDRAFVIGQAPVTGYRLIAGEYLLKLESEGLTPLSLVVQVDVGQELNISRALPETEGVVRVEEGSSLILASEENVPAFLIDRHEVTNGQFSEFVAAGGYRNPEFWPNTLRIDGETEPWEKIVARLLDRTGIPGPREWSGGTYPEGEGDHPVAGVSWYEASAFARWAGKELPTWEQWWRAALGETGEVFPWGNDVMTVEARANFELVGTQPVDSYPLGVSPYGCSDMAGNVREWLRDLDTGDRARAIGGSWQDPTYMFEPSHTESFDPAYANPAIGFRCVKSAPDLE